MIDQQGALDFVREIAKGKSMYRTASILGVSWGSVKNWLSENPKEISYNNLEKIEKLKNEQKP